MQAWLCTCYCTGPSDACAALRLGVAVWPGPVGPVVPRSSAGEVYREAEPHRLQSADGLLRRGQSGARAVSQSTAIRAHGQGESWGRILTVLRTPRICVRKKLAYAETVFLAPLFFRTSTCTRNNLQVSGICVRKRLEYQTWRT